MSILSVVENECEIYKALRITEQKWLRLLEGVEEFRNAIKNGNKLTRASCNEIKEHMEEYPGAKETVRTLEQYLSGRIPATPIPEIARGYEVPQLLGYQRAHNLALKAVARPGGIAKLLENY